MPGSVVIEQCAGRWSVAVDGGRPQPAESLDEALKRAGRVTFAEGEKPGAGRVLFVDP